MEKKNYDKVIKVLQIAALAFMVAMVAAMLVIMNKFDISIENAAALSSYISGGTLTVALIIIAFTVIKSFALIFPPAIILAISGLLLTVYGLRLSLMQLLWRLVLFCLISLVNLQVKIFSILSRLVFRKSKSLMSLQAKTSLWLYMSSRLQVLYRQIL